MKLTTRSEYSLLALIFIARHQDEGFVTIDSICSRYNIPRKYLEQLLLVLKQNRYLKSRRGSGGGYILARPAERITLADIIRLMDGALAPVESVSEYFYHDTPILQEDKLIDIFRDIRDYISGRLERLTLADMV